jgi:hypothetical protein
VDLEVLIIVVMGHACLLIGRWRKSLLSYRLTDSVALVVVVEVWRRVVNNISITIAIESLLATEEVVVHLVELHTEVAEVVDMPLKLQSVPPLHALFVVALISNRMPSRLDSVQIVFTNIKVVY